jgi:hypothetical protein
MKIKCLKRQSAEDAEQLGFFLFAKEARLVEQTFGQIVDGEKRARGERRGHLLIDAMFIDMIFIDVNHITPPSMPVTRGKRIKPK